MDNFELSPPLDLSHHLSWSTQQREASKIKAFYKYFQIPGIANLAGGLPHPSYFPFDTLEARSALPQRFVPTPNNPVDPPSTSSKHKHKHDPSLNNPTPARVTVPHDSHQPNVLQRIDLKTALQYGTAQGYPPLYAFVREFALTRLNPNIPYKNGAEIILTCGNTDGFAKSLECFVNPWSASSGQPVTERSALLCEEFAYMNALQTAKPKGMNIVPIAMDAEGMLAHGHPRSLYNVMSNWNVEKEGSRRPHIMYTVTMGQNPTSGLLSVKRRKEIYDICHEYDVLIVEDDPYFYIQFPHAANEFTQKHRNGQLLSRNHFAESHLNYQTSLAVPVRGSVTLQDGSVRSTTRMRRGESSGSDFLDSLVPSYLSIDVDGRVIRLDTFSKTVAPGCRLGWITAQPDIVERILRITETSTQQPSGFVQSILAEMLIGPDHTDMAKSMAKSGEKVSIGWKVDGWIRWLEGLRGNYERRMRAMCEVLEKGKFHASTHVPASSSKTVQARIARNTGDLRKRRLDSIIACSYSRSRNASQPAVTPLANEEDADSFELLHKVQIYEFDPPMAGMFIWLRLNLELHPLFHGSITPDRLAFAFWVFQTRKPYLTLLAPGSMFAASDQIRKEKSWAYFRVCFAAVDDEQIVDISERFVRGCQDFFDITDEKEIQDLLDEEASGQFDLAMENLSLEDQGRWLVNPAMC